MWNVDDLSLNGDINIKTADQDEITTGKPLRFYIYKEIREPGVYEIRGNVNLVENGIVSWNADSFPGFYYDLDDGIKTENLKMIISDKDDLDECNITYTTQAQVERFKFDEWGTFNVIGFLGIPYFSSYVEGDKNTAYLYYESNDNPDLMESRQISEVLIDYDNGYHHIGNLTLLKGESLNLREGYKLKIEDIGVDGNKVCVVLFKDGNIVNTGVVHPSKEGATTEDKTYTYKKILSEDSDETVVIIAVHFKNAFKSPDVELTTVDGIWQISDSPIKIKEGCRFGNMSIEYVSGEKITMTNED